MSPALHLGPGGALPGWVTALEAECFQSPWGPLEPSEQLWALEPAGFARWRVLVAAQEAELLRIAVAPGRRRAGQGQALLRHCQACLAELGITALFLEVRVSNSPARALYEKEGWTFLGLRPRYYPDGETAALYRRELDRDRDHLSEPGSAQLG